MKKYMTLAAVAPLALLAACADNDAASDDATDEDTSMVAADSNSDLSADVGTDEAQPATKIADAGNYSGTYSLTSDDGTTTRINLDSSDKSYSYTGPDGKERVGVYTLSEDGYRIRFDTDDIDNNFALSNGYLVNLGRGDAAVEENKPVSGPRFKRDDDNAVFSREPVPGSPAAPQANED